MIWANTVGQITVDNKVGGKKLSKCSALYNGRAGTYPSCASDLLDPRSRSLSPKTVIDTPFPSLLYCASLECISRRTVCYLHMQQLRPRALRFD